MFELANSWLLLLLPLPIIYWLMMPKAYTQLPTALKIPFFTAMASIVNQERHSLTSQSSLVAPALIWVLLVVALAGPRWIGEPQPIEREGYNIMMALDLSGSMEIPDMLLHGRPTSRLAVVKTAAEQFVKERTGDKIGLILFGTRAYLQTPLTYDKQTILTRLEDASVRLAGQTTSIGDAIGLAVKRLNATPKQGRVLILLTDGANNSGVLTPIKATELAKEEGIKIYTIGLGADAEASAMVNGFIVPNGAADLDEDTLKQIANLTGGRYFRATDTETLHSIYNTINQLERVNQEQTTVRPQVEYYPWCVSLALLFAFFWLAHKADLRVHINSWSRNQEVLKS
ncbi:MAG: VWA domain-containing protein [Legionella sp.]|uniref:vWA domain-containing protein n=1 Tax=Legionella sp. TaxID=459 RepID=UPI0039E6A0C8